MNKKVTDAKSKLGDMKAKAITDMALAIGLLIGTAYIWGTIQPLKEILLEAVLPFLVTFLILGVYLLGTGIEMLHWKGKLAEALKGIDHNEADE